MYRKGKHINNQTIIKNIYLKIMKQLCETRILHACAKHPKGVDNCRDIKMLRGIKIEQIILAEHPPNPIGYNIYT